MTPEADCIFCKIVAGDIPSTSVYRDDSVMAFEDVQPVAPTHILVVPRSHVGYLSELGGSSEELLGHMALVAGKIAADRGIQQSGYRLVINQGRDAGQAVDHLHLHLIGGRQLGALG